MKLGHSSKSGTREKTRSAEGPSPASERTGTRSCFGSPVSLAQGVRETVSVETVQRRDCSSREVRQGLTRSCTGVKRTVRKYHGNTE